MGHSTHSRHPHLVQKLLVKVAAAQQEVVAHGGQVAQEVAAVQHQVPQQPRHRAPHLLYEAVKVSGPARWGVAGQAAARSSTRTRSACKQQLRTQQPRKVQGPRPACAPRAQLSVDAAPLMCVDPHLNCSRCCRSCSAWQKPRISALACSACAEAAAPAAATGCLSTRTALPMKRMASAVDRDTPGGSAATLTCNQSTLACCLAYFSVLGAPQERRWAIQRYFFAQGTWDCC